MLGSQGAAWVREYTRRVKWSGTSSGKLPATIVSARWAQYDACPLLVRLLFKAVARSYAKDTVVHPPTTAVSRSAFASGLPRFRPARIVFSGSVADYSYPVP